MTIASEALVQLHRIHRQLSDVRGRLARGPKQIDAGQQNLAKYETELSSAKEKATKTKMLADERQLQMREREIRLADLQTKLNSCGSNREYQALTERIAADKQASSVLDDEIFELLERIDEQTVTVVEAKERVATATEDLTRIRERIGSEKEMLESEVSRLTAELKEAEKALGDDIKHEYERLSSVRGEDALAEVDNNVCVGCFTTITSQMLSELLMQKPVFCKSCGRILYLAEKA